MLVARQGAGHTILWTSVAVGLTVVLVVAGFMVSNGLRSASNPPTQSSALVSAPPVPTPYPELAVTGGPKLTVKAANNLARIWYERRDQARFTNDDGALGGLDTGDAYRVDLGTSEQIRCGCTPPKHQHVLTSVAVVVPKPPVTAFVAQFSVTTLEGVPGIYTVVFVAEQVGWRAAVITLEDNPHVLLKPPKTARALGKPAAARKLLNQFGKYLDTARTTRVVPQSPSVVWKGVGPKLATFVADKGQNYMSRGIQHHYGRPVATARAFSIQTAAGQLVCGTLGQTIDITARFGELRQDKDRRNWGRSIPPGNYAGLTESFADHVCMTVQPDGTRIVSAMYGSKLSIKPTDKSKPV
jgi:hypothetical protein